ncbi:MAG: SUMF1/EgtB/PvdO family nonheme iron enzyme [Terrimonas sp.]|nr:SUMF1/EgtB/PvdO family nonheme iron enzyme [Terrimonas sp.]OJY98049.1 MAG: sulfatase-modifying factor [Sphingobacteriales bacterium 40-81]
METKKTGWAFFTGFIFFISLVPGVSAQTFTSYTESVPGTKIHLDMVAIKGGTATIGSPEKEHGRKNDEGPVHSVELDPFWVGKYEITWEQYELFVYPAIEKERNAKTTTVNKSRVMVDAVTSPTPPFTDMSFGMGKTGYPAVNMTQYAALAYCKWLTEKTGHFYRLPTEAEWEYACRAGSNQAYSFGNDKSQLTEYAWYSKNSNEKYQKTGTKKPNAWGLYDMHGNVAEWTLDQYFPDFYSSAGSIKRNAWAQPKTLYPRVVKGGSWDDDAEDLRCAARLPSKASWKQRDPQIPKSDWWNTDASFVGFRIVRPLKQPSAEEIARYFARQPQDL